MSKFMSVRLQRLALGAGLIVASGMAAADTIDVSDAVTSISNGVTTVSTLGVAALSVVVAAKIFKWVRNAL